MPTPDARDGSMDWSRPQSGSVAEGVKYVFTLDVSCEPVHVDFDNRLWRPETEAELELLRERAYARERDSGVAGSSTTVKGVITLISLDMAKFESEVGDLTLIPMSVLPTHEPCL